MKICNICGAEVHDEANFCNMCGSGDFSPLTPEKPADVAPVIEEFIPEEPKVSAPVLDPVNYYTDAGLMPTPSKKHSKVVIAGLVALIAVVLVVIVLANPQRRFMNAVRAGDSAAAGEIYYGSLADKESRKAKADAQVASYVDEQLNLYLNNEITYDAFQTALQTLSDALIENDRLPGALEQAAAVRQRRETFETADAALAAGDYISAITLYRELALPGEENSDLAAAKLEEATGRYRDSVLGAAADAIANDRFGVAYATLKEALMLLPGDDALMELHTQCIEAHHDHTIDAIIAEARGIWESGNYMDALTYLDGEIAQFPKEPRLPEERSLCVAAFEEYAFNEVYRLAAEGNYPDAAALAAQGLGVFESQRVEELQQLCLSHIPVNLGDMEIAVNDTVGGVWNTTTLKIDEYLEDRYAGSYSHSLSVGCGSVTYQLDYRYATFTGVVAFPKDLNSSAAKKSATLTISGDGVQLAVFRNFNANSTPMAFNLDLSPYETITLEWSCKGYNTWLDWGDFATIFDGVLTPIPQELTDGVG